MRRWTTTRWGARAVAVAAAVMFCVPVVGASGSAHPEEAALAPVQAAQRPDIVLILMDDFSTELLRSMPQAQRMKREGAFYHNAFVVDSLCCPSRSALLTGQTPHQTGVLTNTPNSADQPIGGYPAFVANGNARRSFNLKLQQSGYTTGFVGKFLNVYERRTVDGRKVPPPKVPGWTVWNAILGGGYSGWGFQSTWLDRDGHVRLTGHPTPPASWSPARKDADYATHVASDLAVRFLDRQRDAGKPYFLEIATYGPHAALQPAYRGDPAFPPAFRDRPTGRGLGNCGAVACSRVNLGWLKGYDDPRADNRPSYLLPDGTTRPAPAWRTNRITMGRAEATWADWLRPPAGA